MNYDNLVDEILINLKANNKNALSLIKENEIIINENLGKDAKLSTINSFIEKLIDVVIKTEKNKFDALKLAFKYKSMSTVYRYFKESCVMIKAIEEGNKYALEWLQSMDISPYVQDENGMTALMHAIQDIQWNSYLRKWVNDKKCINIEDNNGRTVLFYALVNNTPGLWKIAESGNIDINHKDHYGNNILIYCCKTGRINHFKYFLNRKIDVNATDNEGRTAGMILAMNGCYTDVPASGNNSIYYSTLTDDFSFFQMLNKTRCNLNFINEKGESILSLLIKNMYQTNDNKKFENYVRCLISLTYTNCDFNIPLDDDGNTLIMIIILSNDWETFQFVLRHYKKGTIDFTKKNKNGENATSLFLKSKPSKMFTYVISIPSFDFDFRDSTNGNNVLMFSVIEKPYFIRKILEKKPEYMYEINERGENALIIACKANNYMSVSTLLEYPVPINCQDELGNSALHYAVKCKKPAIIQLLVKKGANTQLKNNEGESAEDIAMKMEDKTVLEALHGDMPPEDFDRLKEDHFNTYQSLDLVEEYTYPCMSKIDYRGVCLSEEQIEIEKAMYEGVEKDIIRIKKEGKLNKTMYLLIGSSFM